MADISSLLQLDEFVKTFKYGERSHLGVFPAPLVRSLTAVLKAGLSDNGVVDTKNEITEEAVKNYPVYCIFRMLQLLALADDE